MLTKYCSRSICEVLNEVVGDAEDDFYARVFERVENFWVWRIESLIFFPKPIFLQRVTASESRGKLSPLDVPL